METKNIFAKRLVDLREAKGISQQILADALGVTRQSLSLYEKAERTVNIELLVKIANYFNVSTDYLLGLSDIQSIDTDMHIACKTTGLNEKAIQSLQYMSEYDPFFMIIFCRLIEDEIKVQGEGLFKRIVRYFITTPVEGEIFVDNAGGICTAKKGSIKRKDGYIIDIQDLINNGLIESIVTCLKEYAIADGLGNKSNEYAENFNMHREFERIFSNDETPVYTISEVIELGLSSKEIEREENATNAQHNPPQE